MAISSTRLVSAALVAALAALTFTACSAQPSKSDVVTEFMAALAKGDSKTANALVSDTKPSGASLLPEAKEFIEDVKVGTDIDQKWHEPKAGQSGVPVEYSLAGKKYKTTVGIYVDDETGEARIIDAPFGRVTGTSKSLTSDDISWAGAVTLGGKKYARELYPAVYGIRSAKDWLTLSSSKLAVPLGETASFDATVQEKAIQDLRKKSDAAMLDAAKTVISECDEDGHWDATTSALEVVSDSGLISGNCASKRMSIAQKTLSYGAPAAEPARPGSLSIHKGELTMGTQYDAKWDAIWTWNLGQTTTDTATLTAVTVVSESAAQPQVIIAGLTLHVG